MRSNRNRTPFLRRAFVIYARKVPTSSERPTADGGHAIGNRYARKAFATIERIFADGLQLAVLAKGYAHKACAPSERIRADLLNRVAQGQL